jgi:hypothetical protein
MRKTTINRLILTVPPAVLLLLFCASAAPAEEQQCILIETEPAPATVLLRHSIGISAASPATFCTLEPGIQYFLIISRPGYETRGVKMKLREDGKSPKFKGFRTRMVGRSMILPGWGQRTLQVNGRIFESVAFLTVAGLRTYQAYKDYSDIKEKYDFYEALMDVSTEQGQKEAIAEPMQKAAMDSNTMREYTWLTAGTTAWLYTENLVESFLLAQPPGIEQTTDFGYKARIPRRSRTRAALRSMFFPGLGQKYYGKTWKGLLFKTGFYTLVWFTLDRWRKYEMARNNYQLSVQRFESADTKEERQRILLESLILYDGMKNWEDSMYYWAIGTGAVWLLNVFDAAVFGGTTEADSRVQFSSAFSPTQSRIGLSVRF